MEKKRQYAIHLMCWGNPDASDNFGEMKVFDTVLGFKGVWAS